MPSKGTQTFPDSVTTPVKHHTRDIYFQINIAHHDKTTNFVTRNFLQNFRVILHIYDCL